MVHQTKHKGIQSRQLGLLSNATKSDPILYLGQQGRPIALLTPTMDWTRNWTHRDISYNSWRRWSVKIYRKTGSRTSHFTSISVGGVFIACSCRLLDNDMADSRGSMRP